MTKVDEEQDQSSLLGIERKILRQAKIKTLEAMNKNPTVENLRAYQAAGKALAEFECRRAERERPAKTEFTSVAEAFRYALSQGYTRTRQTMDNHIKAGRLIASRTGTIRLVDLERYLDLELGALDDAGDGLLSKKLAAEVKRLEAQAEHWRLRSMRERSEVIEVARVEQELATRAAFLRTDLENFFRTTTDNIIDLVDGNRNKGPDLVAVALAALEDWLDRYTRPMKWPEQGGN